MSIRRRDFVRLATAAATLPLALGLSGLLRLRMYTYRWMSLAVWLYFTEACVRAWSDAWPANALALAQGLLCLLLFVACGLHVKLRFKAARAAARQWFSAPCVVDVRNTRGLSCRIPPSSMMSRRPTRALTE